MRTIAGGWLLIALVCSGATAAAQTPPENPRLSLGIAAGTSDVESELQLKVALPPGLQLGRIDALLTYPAETLNFEKIAGHLVEQGRVKVDTEVQAVDGGRRTLRLTVRSAEPGAALPVDALANIVFKVGKEVKPTVLDVALQAKVFTPDGREITPVAVYPGRINVQERAVFFGCFFYMH